MDPKDRNILGSILRVKGITEKTWRGMTGNAQRNIISKFWDEFKAQGGSPKHGFSKTIPAMNEFFALSAQSEPATAMKPEHLAIFRPLVLKVISCGTWTKALWEEWDRARRITRIGWLHSIKDQMDSWGYDPDILIREVSSLLGLDESTANGSSSNQTSPDPGQDRSQEQTTPTPTTDIMSDYSNTPVARPTLVFGEDVSSVSEARAIQLIKANNDQIKELGSIGVTSSRLEQRVAGLKAANAELVKRLDSFATVEAPAEA